MLFWQEAIQRITDQVFLKDIVQNEPDGLTREDLEAFLRLEAYRRKRDAERKKRKH